MTKTLDSKWNLIVPFLSFAKSAENGLSIALAHSMNFSFGVRRFPAALDQAVEIKVAWAMNLCLTVFCSVQAGQGYFPCVFWHSFVQPLSWAVVKQGPQTRLPMNSRLPQQREALQNSPI